MQASLPQAFTRAQAAQIELFTALGHALLNGASQLAPLGIDAVRGALTEAATLASSLPGAKTPQDVVAAQGTYADALRDSTTSYGRNAFEIANQTQAKLTKLIDNHVNEFQQTLQQSVQQVIEQAGSTAPAGATGLVEMLKSIATASASSYQEAAKTLRQAAEATVASATATASAAPTSAARKSKQSA